MTDADKKPPMPRLCTQAEEVESTPGGPHLAWAGCHTNALGHRVA